MVVDFSGEGNDTVSVCITEKRKARLLAEWSEARRANGLKATELISLIGKLQFADAACMGRCGRLSLGALRPLAASRPFIPWSDLSEQAEFWEAYLRASGPRIIQSGRSARPSILICDAAAESLDVGLAGVLLDPVLGVAQFWTHRPSADHVTKWLRDGQSKVIAQAELAAVAISLHTWAESLRGRDVLVFTDNEAVRHAVIKASSSHPASARMCHWIRTEVGALSCGWWMERVASASNIADGPSRGSKHLLSSAGFVEVAPSLPDCVAG